VQGALRRQYLDIGKQRNAVMADSVNSRRARPVGLLGLLRPLAMERPLPADRAYPEALQDALKAWKLMGQDTKRRAALRLAQAAMATGCCVRE
jgi:hypothetical protein